MFRRFDPRARFREIVLNLAVTPAPAKLDVAARFPQLIGLETSASAKLAVSRVKEESFPP